MLRHLTTIASTRRSGAVPNFSSGLGSVTGYPYRAVEFCFGDVADHMAKRWMLGTWVAPPPPLYRRR
jgi:hypothetical protein